MPNCTRRCNHAHKKEREVDASTTPELSNVLLDASSSPLIKFLLNSKDKLQQENADHLPILREIIQSCPSALSGDEAKDFEQAAIDAVFALGRTLLDLVTTKRGPVAQVASLALFNIIPAVVGVRKCVQFLVSSNCALSNVYTKHWRKGMIHWGKPPSYDNNGSGECFAKLQRMQYLMRVMNCRKDMLEQQTNVLKEQLKKHQIYLAGPSRARSKRRYHKRDIVKAEDFHVFKTSLKKGPDEMVDCLQQMRLDNPAEKRCGPAAACKGPDDGFQVKFNLVKAPDILLEIFSSVFEDPALEIRKEFSWNEENVIEQRYWQCFYLQVHLIHGAMESPSAMQIFADSYEDWSIFECFFNVIESALLCPATRNHQLILKSLHGWFDMALMFTKIPMKVHNVQLADDVLGGIRRTMFILNSSIWDSSIFAKVLKLHNLAKQSFANIKGKVKDASVLSFDWTVMLMKEYPWKNKRKLQMLAEVIPYWQDIEIKQITKRRPGVPGIGTYLVESLEFNELRSASCDVFRAVMERFSKEQFIRDFIPVIEVSLTDKKLQPGLANYWLPALIKKYPDVAKELHAPNLFGTIIVLRALRKDGVISLKDLLDTKDGLGDSVLVAGLECNCAVTRSRAISALCQGPNINASWTDSLETMEYTASLVKQFMEDNTTEPAQASRNVIVKALSYYFAALRDFLLLNVKKNKGKNFQLRENPATRIATDFLLWLETFLCKNLNAGHSYDQTIFGLQVYDAFLQVFAPSEKSFQLRTSKLVVMLKNEQAFGFHSKKIIRATLTCVVSKAEDVRSLASKIVLGNPDLETSTLSIDKMLSEALNLSSSSQFYIVDAGAILYKTASKLANIPVEDSLQQLLQLAKKQFDVLKSDLLKGALESCPVYGCLLAINLILQDASTSLNAELALQVLLLVEEVADHVLALLTSKSSTQVYAPSFEDMDWAIEAEINDNYSLDNKSLHLSPQYQYALSCAWLNLKICTELACTLGSIFRSQDDLVWRCSEVIMNVLLKCRHKGAFEAAGVAMASFVKKISAQGSTIPKRMLDKLMVTLHHTGTDAPPLSRRSAGLAVAIHKIVSSDSDDEKALLHDTFEQLLIVQDEKTEESSEVEKIRLIDDVKSRKMHVLYTLISDSGIGQHANCHLENIGQMSIYYLSAEDWGVRNAAMQLFGAFVKKMTVQRKSKGATEDSLDSDDDIVWDICGNGLLEDVLVRSSYLVSQIVAIIKHPLTESNEAMEECSQWTPCSNPPDENAICCALGFLQFLTPGPPSLWTDAQASLVNDITYHCWQLIGHPSWLVRKQAANCCVTMINKCHVGPTLKTLSNDIDTASANMLHGLMMVFTNFKRRLNFFSEDKKKLDGVMKEIESKITAKLLTDLRENKQTTPFVLYKYATCDVLRKDEVVSILLAMAENSDLMKAENYCQMIFSSELVDQIVTYQKEWIPEVLALCCSFESLSSVQEHLLMCLLRCGEISPATEEQLEIAIKFNLIQNRSRHELVSLMKCIIMSKNNVWSEVLSNLGKKSIWQIDSSVLRSTVMTDDDISSSLVKMLTSSPLCGNEFEPLALSIICYNILESIVCGNVNVGCQYLSVISQLITDCNTRELSVFGPALLILSPVTWDMVDNLAEWPDLNMVGVCILKATIALLLEQNGNAAKSIWKLRSSQSNFCESSSTVCLRMIHGAAIDSLVRTDILEQYLWETLQISFEPSHDQDLSSPFSHCDNAELDYLSFIVTGFKSIYKVTSAKMTRAGLPSSTMIEKEFKTLDNLITEFRASSKGELLQLPTELATAMGKYLTKLHILEKFYGVDISKELNAELDGRPVNERIELI